MKRAGWSRDWFSRACAVDFRGASRSRRLLCWAPTLTLGWVYRDEQGRPLWGLRRVASRWDLTHAPTGSLVPGSFERLADGQDFAEVLAAEINCAVGRFGSLKGARGAKAFREAVKRRCALYGFDPVKPVTDRVVYDDKAGERRRRAS